MRSFSLMAKISTVDTGPPVGRGLGASRVSMAASQPQAMTEVAKPVIEVAAVIAQAGVSAVTTIRVATIGNASAKLSRIRTPFRFTTAPRGRDGRSAGPAPGSPRRRP